jgi:hypothetical protein
MDLELVEDWQHGTLVVMAKRAGGAGSIQFATGTGNDVLDGEYGSLPRAMKALDSLTKDDWTVVASSVIGVGDDATETRYLLRRPTR